MFAQISPSGPINSKKLTIQWSGIDVNFFSIQIHMQQQYSDAKFLLASLGWLLSCGKYRCGQANMQLLGLRSNVACKFRSMDKSKDRNEVQTFFELYSLRRVFFSVIICSKSILVKSEGRIFSISVKNQGVEISQWRGKFADSLKP